MATDFGNVRNVTRDSAFLMASGPSLDDQIQTQAAKTVKAKREYDQAVTTWRNHKLQRVEGNYCADNFPKRKRAQCQDDQQAWLNIYSQRMQSAKANWESEKAQLANLQAEKQAEIEATEELASQGLTKEAVQTKAEAEAAAIVAQAQAQAQSEMQRSVSRSKTIKIIIISLVIAGILTAAFFMYRKLAKKKGK